LEDVILRSQSQDFYQDKFILCGHSLGGMCVLLYAEHHPEHMKAILPLSAVISGNLSKETYSSEKLEEREQTGRRIQERSN
jgi:pimeloyl-ACP methyl ester carboxylesterase